MTGRKNDKGEKKHEKQNITWAAAVNSNSVDSRSIDGKRIPNKDSIAVTVQAPPAPALTTITISPATATLVAGGTHTFTATALDQFGNPIATTITWSSSNTTVGTIDTTGKFKASRAGTTTIMAANGTVNGTATVTAATPGATALVTFVVTESITGKPVKDAKVSVKAIKKSLKPIKKHSLKHFTIKTNQNGIAVFSGVPAGVYTYRVSKDHFLIASSGISISSGVTMPVKLIPNKEEHDIEEQDEIGEEDD